MTKFNEQLNVYVPDGTRARIQALAEPKGQKIAAWLREKVLAALNRAEAAINKED